ncbi:hypothetical protein HIM_10744 [Hirsutella minnesotensis 3608]|uniref:Uncharacterized protein n=1 Tax=Hirsutella minnesotensis 3608 TaxID=1043627 RepID=A0A0F7ZJR5_9HYPO|nr:hypothetical protein HIM_10744 [Hirsutella minnesotensis 3608]
MASHLVTQGSVRCGHIHSIDQKKCGHKSPCRLGDSPFQIITQICGDCSKSKHFHDNFGDLREKPALLYYWVYRKHNDDRHFWGPLKSVMNVCIPKSISGEEESLMRGIWQEEAGRFVKLASKGASAIFTEGHGYCSIEEFDSVKGRELLEKTIEIVLMETEEARSVA